MTKKYFFNKIKKNFIKLKNFVLKNKNIYKKNAFTLIETMISITLLVFVFTIASMVYFNFVKEYKYSLERNNIFSETNFLFETISKHIKNSDIDYQSYWRENTRIKQISWNNKIADLFLDQWPNPDWVNSDLLNSNINKWFNSVLNCSWWTIDSFDYNYENEEFANVWTWRFILENYKYQFIFPWNAESPASWWADEDRQYNLQTTTSDSSTIHLNCKTDFVKENPTKDWNQQNIYDDDPVYWRWPKAFSWSFSQNILWTDNYNNNSKKTINTPLILVNSKWNKRVAFKFWDWEDTECKNWSWCILFLEMNAKTFDSNWIANSWKCADDFICPENLTWIISDEIKWLDITPENLIITQFDFYIWPEKKSSLAFNEPKYNKPSFITLKLWIKSAAFQSWNQWWRKNWIELNLQSTIIPRNNSKTINVLN